MNSSLAIATGAALATVLAISGAAKLTRPAATVRLFAALRLPPVLARLALVRIFAVAELLLVGGLVASADGGYGAIVSAVVAATTLFVILGFAGLTLRTPTDCGCFGELVESKTGVGMVTRNLILWSLALVLGSTTIAGSRSGALLLLVDADGNLAVEPISALAGIASGGLLVFGSQLRHLVRKTAIEGSPEPMQYTGRLDTIPSGISAGTTLLLRPGCSGCERVLDRLESLIEANPGADIGATILVDAELEQFARVRPLVAEHSRFGFDGLNERFGIRTLPAAVFLEPDGRFLRRVGSSAVLLLLPPDEHTGSGSEKINSGSPAG